MSAGNVAKSVTWWLIALLSVGVGGYALYHAATGFAHVPTGVLENHNLKPVGIQTHIAASGVAMLVGAFQFHRGIRSKLPLFHRWLGRIYIAACTIGGFAGGMIALGTTAGPVAGWGFLSLALLWVPFTLLAWFAAMRRDFISHEQWMIRSFALTFGAVTLRLYLPVVGLMDWDFLSAYRIIAWAAWVPNLIVAEIWIALRNRPRRRKVTPSPTPA